MSDDQDRTVIHTYGVLSDLLGSEARAGDETIERYPDD